MAKQKYVCPQCGNDFFQKSRGRANRAKKIGAPMYCGRACAGLARRLKNPPTPEEKKAAKAVYDKARREKLHSEISAYKRQYRLDHYDEYLEKEAIYREKRMPKHLEYCRTPQYRAWKKKYDRQYRAQKEYGEFGDAAVALFTLNDNIKERATKTEIYKANGTLNKTTQRRRSLG